MAKLQVTPIIGLPQFNGWSQVTTNSQRSLVCALAVFGQNAGNIGRDIVNAVEQASPKSAAEFHTFLQTLIDEAEQAGGQPALACLLAVNNQSILVTYQASILLKRNGKVGVIVSSTDYLKLIEGHYIPDDVLVLATIQGSSYLGEIQQKIHQGFDLDTIITSLVPAIHSSPNSSLTSLGFVTLGEWEAEPELKPEPEDLEIKLPELEITLETIEEEQEKPPILPDLPTDIPLANTPEIEPLPIKKPPISIMWTKSSRTQLLPSLGELFSKIVSKIRPVASGVYSGGRSRLKTVNWSRLNPKILIDMVTKRDVYVTRHSRRKILKVLVPIVVFLILGILGLLVWRTRQAQQVQAAQTAMEPITAQFTSAKDRIQSDPVGARQQMEESISQLEGLEQDFSGQSAGRRAIVQTLESTRQEFAELSGREELSSLPIFFDLSTIESDWIANQADGDGNRMALLDEGKKQIVVFDITSKQSQVLPALESQPADMSLNQDKIYALGGGVWQATLTDESIVFSRAVEEGDSNRSGILLGSFGTYLYVVNPERRNIFRYSGNDQGFSEPIGWFRPGQQFFYDNLHSMSIDGDIWIGTTDGKIIKLATGEVVPFEVKGLPEPFTSSLIVYTKENQQYLYVLEPATRRLVILEKTGEFIRQIKSGSLAATTSLVVNEEAAKALVVSGSLIFEVAF